MEIAKSDIVRSDAGRDQGKLFVVLAVEGEYLLLADGKGRKAESPKRKKRKHVLFVAEDDSRLTACILQRVWDTESFAGRVKTADEEFYARLTFKNRIVSAEDDPLVKREYLQFSCPSCGKPLRAKKRRDFFARR